MKSEIITIIKDHYATYIDGITKQREAHGRRITFQIAAGILCALFVSSLSEGAIAVIVTSLSILTGFSFSAMFPIASDIKGDLPDPIFAEDRDDLKRLSDLASNFRANVAYFIALTLTCIMLFSIQLIDLTRPDFVTELLTNYVHDIKSTDEGLQVLGAIGSRTLHALSAFFLLEGLYSFYRMSFTVLDILRIKENYRVEHEKRAEQQN